MLVKTEAIVLNAIKFQEKSLIVKCYTQSDGLKSYFVQNAFTGKNNKQKNAFFQPLNILEIEANHKNKNTLERFKDISLAHAYTDSQFDIKKTTIRFFLADILNVVLKEENKDDDLYLFLKSAFIWLDAHENCSNFHLYFLVQLSKYLGFYTDISSISEPFFNIQEGFFQAQQNLSCLSAEATILFKKGLLLERENSEMQFSGNQRRALLEILLKYYQLNWADFKIPKSLEVLQEILM